MPVRLGELEVFTLDELEERLSIQKFTLRRYLKAGRLKGRKIANRWYVTAESLREFFEPEDMAETARPERPSQKFKQLGLGEPK